MATAAVAWLYIREQTLLGGKENPVLSKLGLSLSQDNVLAGRGIDRLLDHSLAPVRDDANLPNTNK